MGCGGSKKSDDEGHANAGSAKKPASNPNRKKSILEPVVPDIKINW